MVDSLTTGLILNSRRQALSRVQARGSDKRVVVAWATDGGPAPRAAFKATPCALW